MAKSRYGYKRKIKQTEEKRRKKNSGGKWIILEVDD